MVRTQHGSHQIRGPRLGLLLLVFWVLASPAQAWGPHGHATVAAIAWELMSDEAKLKSVSEIQNHKRYQEIFDNRMPDEVRNGPADRRNKWIFLQAGLAPDTAKDLDDDPEQNHFHKGKWHYISFPEYLDPSHAAQVNPRDSLKTTVGRRCGLLAHRSVKNAIQALKTAECVIRYSRWKSRRGKYLTWLVHLSGDAHQPLHAAKLFTPNVFNRGDRGGGWVIVRAAGRTKNLHSLWDGFPGRAGRNFSFVLARVESDVDAFFSDRELVEMGEAAAADSDYEVWFNESNDLAVRKAYGPLRDQLWEAERRNVVGPRNRVDIGGVSSEYIEEGKEISSSRVVVAGYRLAAILNDIYDEEVL